MDAQPLNPRKREVLMAWIAHGRSKAADILCIEPSTVDWYVHTARKELRMDIHELRKFCMSASEKIGHAENGG